jgi:flagellar protein FliS
MTTYANLAAAKTYQRQAILTASPEKLIKLLYDGAIRFLERAKLGLSDPSTARSAGVGEALGRSLAIVSELRTSLDHERGGEISQQLESLYEYCTDQLTQANVERTPEGVENALRVLRTVKEGWDAIVPN